MPVKLAHRGLFPDPVVYALLAISVLTNVILLGRAAHIDWHRFVHRDQAVPALADRDHVRGDANATVTVIEYSDFQCPFCAQFHAVLKQALDGTPRIRWVYRNFPLTEIHPLAERAAEAAECAANQHRFWEYADALFERQRELQNEQFALIAHDLHLDEAQFATCLGGDRARTRVSADAKTFYEGHITGTPTSFINGRRVEGAVSAEDLQRAVQTATRSAPISQPSGFGRLNLGR
jgi:protein-disulfide isomerase